MRCGGRTAVLPGAKKSHIETVPKVRNAIALAAEEGNGMLGGEDQTKIGVAFVLIEIVAAAGKKANYGTGVACLCGAIVLDFLDIGVARPKHVGGCRQV